jgi:hypothetical protein
MNLTATLRLVWKEYRAVRGFWLSIVVLVVLLQWFISAVSYSPTSVTLLYSIGLAAPAFFAIGATGAAFAMEREEGTLDFLRTAPVTAGQVFASKLGLAVAAAIAMLAVLAASTVLFTYPRSPEPLDGMLGLWLVAVLEASAWGTLFSLLTARPLVAIVMAVAVASTVAHSLAWSVAKPPIHPFELAPYLAAVPLRALLATAVLVVDAYLGLRWLGAGEAAPRKRSAIAARADQRVAAETATAQAVATRLLTKPDRGGMLGHLFWLHWRQSAWLMLLIASLHVGLTLIVILKPELPQLIAVVPLLVCSALMGCFVFLADQEQARYRFFVEHGIPPRYVWLTRQFPWLVTLLVSTTIIMAVWVGPRNLFKLWILVQTATDPWAHWWKPSITQFDYIQLPPVALIVVGTVLCYAAGQWASMMVRSGVMVGISGLALATLLCSWAVLMNALHVSWTWSVAPIPLVLMGATWLRAPDWVSENTRFAARARAAAVVLAPAFALAIAMPIYRVHELPLVSPGFDPVAYESTITPAARQTAEIYRRANDLYASASSPIEFYDDRAPSESAIGWLDKNAEPLAMVLEASRRPTCVFDDPHTVSDPAALRNGMPLVQLVVVNGRRLEFEGQLDAALDQYFAALRVVSQLANNFQVADSRERLLGVKLVFAELVAWASHKDQTAEGLRGAIKRFQDLDHDLLRLDDRLKTEYIVARRYVLGDPSAWQALFGRGSHDQMPPMRWPKLMPWEEDRGLRALNLISASNLQRLEAMRKTLAEHGGVVDELPLLPDWYSAEYIWNRNEGWNDVRRPPSEFAWVAELTPQLWEVNELGTFVDLVTAELAARRRGTLLLLALEAYRLGHGELPASLDNLVGSGLDALPHDPYSGRPFCYYPLGLPNPATGVEEVQLKQVRSITSRHHTGEPPLIPGTPCIWCTGPFLHTELYRWPNPQTDSDKSETEKDLDDCVYYTLRQPDQQANPRQMPMFIAWGRGFWFPIPPRHGGSSSPRQPDGSEKESRHY